MLQERQLHHHSQFLFQKGQNVTLSMKEIQGSLLVTRSFTSRNDVIFRIQGWVSTFGGVVSKKEIYPSQPWWLEVHIVEITNNLFLCHHWLFVHRHILHWQMAGEGCNYPQNTLPCLILYNPSSANCWKTASLSEINSWECENPQAPYSPSHASITSSRIPWFYIQFLLFKYFSSRELKFHYRTAYLIMRVWFIGFDFRQL